MFFFMKASYIKVSNLIKWSIMLFFFLKLVGIFDIRLFVSKYHVSLVLIILSMVLQMQLVRSRLVCSLMGFLDYDTFLSKEHVYYL